MNRHHGVALSLVYFVWPFFLFRRFVATDPRRTQSVCSLLVALCLSPIGIREALGLGVTAVQQRHATELYLVFTVTDMVLGLLYYRKHMRWLDGWVHHSASGAFALYCLATDRCSLVSQAMIVEVPTILLSLPRVFPVPFHNPIVKKYLFPLTFFLCRLVAIPFLVSRNRLFLGEKILSIAFTGINALWFTQCVRKEFYRVR